MQRKHEIIVEVTFDKPISSEDAEGTIEFILESDDLRWMRSEDFSIEKMTVKNRRTNMTHEQVEQAFNAAFRKVLWK